MKILRVGDPHFQVSNLKDAEKLIDFVVQTAEEQEVRTIEFLGDLFHTHAVVRTEVIDFWQKSLDKIKHKDIDCYLLCGNHDQPGSKEKEQEMNALITLKDIEPMHNGQRFIIDTPEVFNKIGYIPYMSNEEAFFKAAQDLYDQGATGLLVAHQTFTGAQYENGFFSEEGIDPALVPQKEIISGHIHKCQQVGKCFYPGTPKWDTMSDANHDKGIWIFEHNEDGTVKDKKFISTENVVTPIKTYEIKEGDDLPELNPEARNYVILEGKSAWITKTKKKIKNAQIKVKPTDRISKTNRDNNMTLETYLDKEFNPIEGVKKEDIKGFLREV